MRTELQNTHCLEHSNEYEYEGEKKKEYEYEEKKNYWVLHVCPTKTHVLNHKINI